ncbi:MAG TPA: helix-turn-helix transcriptional regulator [Clostridiaceae bacterium]|nr:helix-turn-helix transcriptional regulator [Clostridiaceae bacterium]
MLGTGLTTKEEFETFSYETIKKIKLIVAEVNHRNWHVHKELELLLVLEGEGIIRTKANEAKIKSGDILILNSFVLHDFICPNNQSLVTLSIVFSDKYCEEYTKVLRNIEFKVPDFCINDMLEEEVLDMQKQILVTAISYFKTGLFEKQKCEDFLLMSDICKLFYILLKNVPHEQLDDLKLVSKGKKNNRIETILNYIENNFKRQIRLSDVAEKVQLTDSYLSNWFVDNIGVTFQEYVQNLRFEEALNLIENTEWSLVDICLESGFSDPKYLNQMFRKRYGHTMNVYRKNKKKKNIGINHELAIPQSLKILNNEESISVIQNALNNLNLHYETC